MKLREHRKSKKLTQAEYADAIGTTETSIHRIETGTQRPGLDMLKAISDFSNGKVSLKDFE